MNAGLNRCGKSCRLRWTNYLRPDLKHDSFTPQEEDLIVNLHKAIGSRWVSISSPILMGIWHFSIYKHYFSFFFPLLWLREEYGMGMCSENTTLNHWFPAEF